MPTYKPQWCVDCDYNGDLSEWRAELSSRPFASRYPLLAMTRWVKTKSQARKDGRKVFARFEELKDD